VLWWSAHSFINSVLENQNRLLALYNNWCSGSPCRLFQFCLPFWSYRGSWLSILASHYNSNLNLRMTIFPVYCLTLTVCHKVIGAKSAKNEGVLVMPIWGNQCPFCHCVLWSATVVECTGWRCYKRNDEEVTPGLVWTMSLKASTSVSCKISMVELISDYWWIEHYSSA
jgi:hypothetical protein